MEKRRNYGTYIMWVLWIGLFFQNVDKSNINYAGFAIKNDLDLTTIQLGILLSAYALPYGLANLFAGVLIDKFGEKRVVITASVLWAATTFVMNFANSFISIYVIRVLMGIFESPVYPCIASLTKKWFKKKNRPVTISWVNTAGNASNFITPPILTAMLISFGWRPLFMFLGGATLIFPLLWYFVVRKPTQQEADFAAEGDDESNIVTKVGFSQYLNLLKNPTQLALMLGCFGSQGSVWLINSWLPTYFMEARHLSTIKTGYYSMLPFLFGILGGVASGYETEWLIKRGVNPIKARGYVTLIPAILAILLILPITAIEDNLLAMLDMSLAYFFVIHCNNSALVFASFVAPKGMTATVFSVQNFAGYIGATISPIAVGVIVQATRSYTLAFGLCAVFLVITGCFYFFGVRKEITLE